MAGVADGEPVEDVVAVAGEAFGGDRQFARQVVEAGDMQVHAAHAKADAEASTARGEYDAACRALDAWGQHELDAATRAWFAARASVLGHDAETEAVA